MSNFNLATATFGIEIECCVPVNAVRENGIVVGGYHRGIQVAALPTGWNAQGDSSIDAPRGYVGIEFVSPKLSGTEGIAQVVEVLAKLNAWGCRVNASTGLHVHVGVEGLDAAALARLICLVSYNEKAIYASTGTKSRENGHFCNSIKGSHKRVADAKTTSEQMSLAQNTTRYSILNLKPLADGLRKAVEFRAFAGTMNIIKLKGAIMMCLAMVEKASETKKAAKWDAKKSNNAKFAAKGEGFASLTYMLKRIGWIKTRLTQPTFGLLCPEDRLEMVKELLRLADKYDAQA